MLITPRELEKYGFEKITVDHYEGHGVSVKVWEDEDRLDRYTIDGTRLKTIEGILDMLKLSVVAMARGRVNQNVEIPVFETKNKEYFYPKSPLFTSKNEAIKAVFEHINTV